MSGANGHRPRNIEALFWRQADGETTVPRLNPSPALPSSPGQRQAGGGTGIGAIGRSGGGLLVKLDVAALAPAVAAPEKNRLLALTRPGHDAEHGSAATCRAGRDLLDLGQAEAHGAGRESVVAHATSPPPLLSCYALTALHQPLITSKHF